MTIAYDNYTYEKLSEYKIAMKYGIPYNLFLRHIPTYKLRSLLDFHHLA
jgi:hypothetical protein